MAQHHIISGVQQTHIPRKRPFRAGQIYRTALSKIKEKRSCDMKDKAVVRDEVLGAGAEWLNLQREPWLEALLL